MFEGKDYADHWRDPLWRHYPAMMARMLPNWALEAAIRKEVARKGNEWRCYRAALGRD